MGNPPIAARGPQAGDRREEREEEDLDRTARFGEAELVGELARREDRLQLARSPGARVRPLVHRAQEVRGLQGRPDLPAHRPRFLGHAAELVDRPAWDVEGVALGEDPRPAVDDRVHDAAEDLEVLILQRVQMRRRARGGSGVVGLHHEDLGRLADDADDLAGAGVGDRLAHVRTSRSAASVDQNAISSQGSPPGSNAWMVGASSVVCGGSPLVVAR